MTIITTAIASSSKPTAPVSEAVLARSGLTKAVIFVNPFPTLLFPLHVSVESERHEIVTGETLPYQFLSVDDGLAARGADSRDPVVTRG